MTPNLDGCDKCRTHHDVDGACQPSLPLDLPPSNLRTIEGGRAIAARNVHASFAVDSDAITTGIGDMAGYVLMAWDDEGTMMSAHHFGSRNPFSPAMMPDLVRGRLAADVLAGDDA